MKSLILTSVLLVVALSACGDDALAPQFEPEVVNLQDSFSFQTTGITNITQVLTYNWENTGTRANVDQSSSLSDGSATLVVIDSQQAIVYAKNLADDGSFPTSVGVAGIWTIQVTLTEASGTLNFSLEKRTP